MFKQFFNDIRGNVALSTAIMALPILMGAGIAVDYSLLSRAESALQNAADAAALASAKELSLSNADTAAIEQISTSYVHSNLTGQLNVNESENTLTVDTVVEGDSSGLTVNLAFVWKPFILQYISNDVLPLRVSASAKVAGDRKICMLALHPTQTKTIHLTQNASLEAVDCGVFSNSTQRFAMQVDDNASIVSGVTCSSGGVRAATLSSFAPTAITDCPPVADPLLNRPEPTYGACDHNDFQITSGIHTLNSGTYCGGLKISGTAEARLQPGVYVIKDGMLDVTDSATISGDNVGFYLTGEDAKLFFRKETTISLTAPKTGIMAGMLFFEERSAAGTGRHQITSDNARVLLGTIYIPNGILLIDSEGPVADQSAYTAIVTRGLILAEGPTLTLNSDYNATDIPVPEGLAGGDVYLAD